MTDTTTKRNKVAVAFLDRDGTLIKVLNGRPANNANEVELLPGVPAGLRELKAAGLRLIVVTNQGGVALGYTTETDVRATHERINELLTTAGAPNIDAFYFCPHAPSKACACRKPNPGLFFAAKGAQPDINFGASYMIGDHPTDMDAAVRAGIKCCVMVLSDRSQDSPHAKIMSATFKDAAHAVAMMESAR